jgi:hypothetical protein
MVLTGVDNSVGLFAIGLSAGVALLLTDAMLALPRWALRHIPAERVRHYTCYGINMGPRTGDAQSGRRRCADVRNLLVRPR